MNSSPSAPPRTKLTLRQRLRIAVRILAVLAFLGLVTYVVAENIPSTTEFVAYARKVHLDMGFGSMLFLCFLFALLTALPFVPGLQMALLIIILFGEQSLIWVYIATLVGLSLAFFIGRCLPERWILHIYNPKVRHITYKIPGSQTTQAYLTRLAEWFKWIPFEIKRVIAIVVLLNLPGNTMYGDGGGISILCGMDRRFPFPQFFIAICIGASPLPILVGFGFVQIANLLN